MATKKSNNINKDIDTLTHKNNKKIKKTSKKKKSSLCFKIGMILLITTVFLISFGAAIFFKSMNSLTKVELDSSKLGITDHSELEDYEEYTKIKNIMIFGVDTNGDDTGGRSDAMMLLTIDPIHDKLKLTSLMRDCYVAIDGHYDDKLNHAYAYGGPELAIKTINQNFGLNVEEFATVDFATLPIIIDSLGGVEVNIKKEEFDDINAVIKKTDKQLGKSTEYLTHTGLQTLNGDQALAYSRNRDSVGGDFARTERQRTIINAIFKKALTTPISNYPTILNELLPLVTTNMTSGDILSLSKNILSIRVKNLEQARFPLDEYAEGGYINGLWYLLYDRETTKLQIQDYIFDDKLPIELMEVPDENIDETTGTDNFSTNQGNTYNDGTSPLGESMDNNN